jgi:hypothetical protein
LEAIQHTQATDSLANRRWLSKCLAKDNLDEPFSATIPPEKPKRIG